MTYLIATGCLLLAVVGGLLYYRGRMAAQAEQPVTVLDIQKWRRRIDGAEKHSYKCRCRACQQKSRLRRAS